MSGARRELETLAGLREAAYAYGGTVSWEAYADALIAHLREYAEDMDYCVVCDSHPSRGHSPLCPVGDAPAVPPEDET